MSETPEVKEIEEMEEEVWVKTYRTDFYQIKVAAKALENFEDRMQNLKANQAAHVEKFVDLWLMQKIRLVKQEDNRKIPILPQKGQFDKDMEKFKKKLFTYLLVELRKQKKLVDTVEDEKKEEKKK